MKYDPEIYPYHWKSSRKIPHLTLKEKQYKISL